MISSTIPKFFEDKSENLDHELMLDYFLSWTLRCAKSDNEDIKLRDESKKILSYLLFDKQEEFFVESIETWKQWRQIDLCAEVIINRNNISEKYALLFENKMYTHIHSNQLERYQKIFEEYYKSPENSKTDYKRKYIFLTCFYLESDYKSDFEECRKLTHQAYQPLSFGWLKSKTGIKETGNYLFDEFWFRYW